jgi:hypothetical protein
MRPRGEFRCHQEANSFSLLWGIRKSPCLSFARTSGGPNLESLMEPDAADINPTGRQPNKRNNGMSEA